MDKPTLETSRLTLRPLKIDYLESYLGILAEPESLELTGTTATFSREQVVEYLQRIECADDRFDWGIFTRANDVLIGEVVLNEIDQEHNFANLRIAISKEREKGFGTESIEKILEFAFHKKKLNKVELEVYEFNERAIHVYKKLGFQVEGVRREIFLKKGKYYNSYQMGMLAKEFPSNLKNK